MIWSGFAILWANDVTPVASRPSTSRQILETLGFDHRLALGLAWHLSVMWVFVLNGFAYVAYLVWSGAWREVVPNRGTWREAFDLLRRELRLKTSPVRIGKYNPAQRVAYSAIVAMGLGSMVSGVAVYKPMRLSPLTAAFGGYVGARLVHFWLTVGFLVFFVVHVGQVARAGWGSLRGMITGYELVSSDEESA